MSFSKFKYGLAVLIGAQFCLSPAFANDFDRDGVRGEIYCFPTKFASETISKLKNADAEKKDVVAPPLTPKFRIFDGGELPQRYFIRGEEETDFTIKPDGATPDFMVKVEAAETESDICIRDETRIGRPGDDEGLYFEMGLTPEFKNMSGTHSLAELKEGVKDGKSLYKKMIPAVARMFMPSTDHLSLKYELDGTPFGAVAFKGEEALDPIEVEVFNDSYVFDIDALKKMEADRLVISGGNYILSPVPSVKTMRKFGIGEKKVYTKNEAGEWVR